MIFSSCPCATCSEPPFEAEPAHELFGQRFGRLTVLGEGEKRTSSNRHVLCLCDCGTVKSIPLSSIKGPPGSCTRSCGCIRREWLAEKRAQHEMVGERFGELLVLRRDEERIGQAYYVCRCDCGRVKSIKGQRLRNGRAKTCGCRNGRNPDARKSLPRRPYLIPYAGSGKRLAARR